MRSALAIILTCAATALPAAADTVHLRDGQILDGKLKRRDAGSWVMTGANGRPAVVADADVTRIELTARPVLPGRRLDALRRSVAASDNADDVVARYRRFIATDGDATALAAARQDLAIWQDRVDRHLVRLGDRWVVPAAREQAAVDAVVTADHARRAVRDGRFADAEPLVIAALAADPQCASAHYLLGLLRVQSNQLTVARRSFERAAVLVPNHGPTFNNLAVVNWQQHRYADALTRYDEAMQASPGNPAVLDNVATALAALPAVVARQPVAARVSDRYRDQRKQLTDQMTALNLHPFGSAWLTDDQLAQVQRGQDRDRQQLDALTTDFDQTQDKVRQTDLAIAEVEDHQRRSTTSGAVGPYLASYDGTRGAGLSTAYFELQNDADQLQRRRATHVAHLDDVRLQAATIRRRLAGEVEGGAPQRLIGPDGTPVRLPAPPTTQPAH